MYVNDKYGGISITGFENTLGDTDVTACTCIQSTESTQQPTAQQLACNGLGYADGCSACAGKAKLTVLAFRFTGDSDISTKQSVDKYSVVGVVPANVLEVVFAVFDDDGIEVFAQALNRSQVAVVRAADFGDATQFPTTFHVALYDASQDRGMGMGAETEFTCDGLLCVTLHA